MALELKKAKNCFSCRAFKYLETFTGNADKWQGECKLKYSQSHGIPQELCPKPLTIKKYQEARIKEA